MNRIVANEGFYDGTSFDAYQLFGAHVTEEGVWFCVYAPSARAVEVAGSFNNWSGGRHQMHREKMYGVYTLMVPEAKEWDLYKFKICGADGVWRDHADPYGRFQELRPATASIVWRDHYVWSDEAWMSQRGDQKNRPVNIYEMHFGSWRQPYPGQCYQYDQLAEQLIPYLKENHFTHIELMPLCEYPFDGSWGYQCTGYFAPTSRYGNPDQLRHFINTMHQAGIGVILDFVPIHFAVDGHGLSYFDGTCLYEYGDFDVGQSEWGSKNFNFFKGEVRSFLNSSAAFWIKEFHMDGIRMDAVRNGIYWQGNPQRGVNGGAISFFQNMNEGLHRRFPGVLLIAEDSSDYPGVTLPPAYNGLGFDYKWDMGWMHDTLDYFATAPWQRQQYHNKITFSMYYFYNEAYLLSLSHDEVVHGKHSIVDKMWGTYDEKFAQAKTLYAYMFTHPGKKLNFMGNEFAQFREWDEREQQDWLLLQYPKHQEFHLFFQRLSALYLEEKAMYVDEYGHDDFSWIDADDASHQVFPYQRMYREERIYVILNMSAAVIPSYPVATDQNGCVEVLLDSDSWKYGGSYEGCEGQTYQIVKEPYLGKKGRFSVRLGAYGSVILKGIDQPETAQREENV